MRPYISFNGVQQAAVDHKKELLAAFSRVTESGVFLEGKENARLSLSLEKKLGQGRVTTCASGHDALLLALQSLDLTPSDEVIIPANAYPTAFPVVLSGATAVLADVDQNGQLDPTFLQAIITKKTKVVILVHMYGLVGNVDPIRTLCTNLRISLIEDCAQAFGATWKGQPVGTLSDIGCFSFYPTKNLGSAGDGGAICTKNKSITSFIRGAKQYGEIVKYESQRIAGHSRLPELQAASLLAALRVFPKNQKKRHLVYQWYKEAINVSNIDTKVRLLSSHPLSTPAPHLLVIDTDQRDRMRVYLSSKKIPTLVHYPHAVHLVPAFAMLGRRRGDFPVAERLSDRVISLPFHEFLTKKDVYYIVDSLKRFFQYV